MSKSKKHTSAAAPKGALYATPMSYKWPLFKQRIYIFDNNILDKLHMQPGEGHGLGDLLHDLRDPSKPREAIVLLPAVAEANYRSTGGAASVLRKYESYFEPHFGMHGVQEVGAFLFQKQSQTLPENLVEISYRVLINYWLLCTARISLEGRRKKTARADALRHFFDSVASAGCYPKSKFPLLAVATALAGNSPASDALNIKDATVESLMNGSWDLLYWHGHAQLSLDSEYTGRVSQLYSYDPDAVGLFLRMELEDGDSVRLVYDGDVPEGSFHDEIQRGMRQVFRASPGGEAIVERIHAVLPRVYHCREYLCARALFQDSLAMCRRSSGQHPVFNPMLPD